MINVVVGKMKTNKEFKVSLFEEDKPIGIRYKICNINQNPLSKGHLKEVNVIGTEPKVAKRINKLTALGYKITFDSFEDNEFKLNLQLIDSELHVLMAHVVLDTYRSGVLKISEIIEKLKADKPLHYDQSQGHGFYEYRLVNFLVEATIGKNFKSIWSREPNAEYLRGLNEFREELKNASRLDLSTESKVGLGEVYTAGNETFMRLGFQLII